MSDADLQRRFGGIARLYGESGATCLRQAHIAVIGIGGVGSWAAEALARSGVGNITLIDLDNVAESNVNRQIHALDDAFGKAKVRAMAERIHAINPACAVTEIEEFVTEDNLAAMLEQGYDCVIDAIDQARVKAAMIAWCRRRKIKLITCGGAGGRVDPGRVQVADLARTLQDPLLARIRTLLRKEHGLQMQANKKFGIECVFSTEPLQQPVAGACDVDAGAQHPQGLNCAGYGSVVTVTAVFGMQLAARAMAALCDKPS